MKYLLLFVTLPFLWLFSRGHKDIESTFLYSPAFEYCNDTCRINLLTYKTGNAFLIEDTIDLCGKTLYLPVNSKLIIRNGLIRNGNIVGNNTNLVYSGAIFDRIHIKGIWNVRDIRTSMFLDLDYDNSLQDVFALANPSIRNTILIEPGLYHITATKPSDRCLVIKDNTDVTIEGEIILSPNGYDNYNIIRLYGDNILVKGSGIGSIKGDKFSHLGDKGEWGMGIEIVGGYNIQVSDLSVSNCWGDCIYIAGKAKKVLIENCHLDNGRRQGVSVCSADSVFIRNCYITNVKGTAPERAIDVEPNDDEIVNYVLIDGVQVNNCVGGIMSYCENNKTSVNMVEVSNCHIDNTEKTAMSFTKTRNVIASGNNIGKYGSEKAISIIDVNKVTFTGNTIKGYKLKKKQKNVFVSQNKR